jgi:hypothetical protein
MTKDNTTTNVPNEAESPAFLVGAFSGSLLMRSLSLLEEMLDNHQADAVQMSEQHYKEVKKLVKDIRKSKRLSQ